MKIKGILFLLFAFISFALADDFPPNRFGVLKVEIKIGTDLKDRTLVGESDRFSKDLEQLVGWTQVKGAKEPIDIKHVWLFNGKEVRAVKVPVRSTSYRTWSFNKIKNMAGTWSLEVRDYDGNVVASKSFEVTDTAP